MGCTEDEEIENIETFVNGGGLYFGVVKYNATQTQFVNNRHTVDGLPCIFPFKYKNKMYYDCTYEDYDLPWCTTNFDSILNPKRLNEARKLEAPKIRNAKFCKELVEAMVGAIEDDHKEKGGKRGSNKK